MYPEDDPRRYHGVLNQMSSNSAIYQEYMRQMLAQCYRPFPIDPGIRLELQKVDDKAIYDNFLKLKGKSKRRGLLLHAYQM